MIKAKPESCSLCGQVMISKSITLLRKKNNKIYSFVNTPAQVCPDCGERWFASETLKIMDEMIKGKVDFPYHSVDAIEFSFSVK
jgi:YgiT-type zinc finger domain-containing protein